MKTRLNFLSVRCLREVGCWVFALLFSWSSTWAAPENPLLPAEEEFFRKAQLAFEKNELETVDLNLQRFRSLVGQRPIPDEVRLTVADLAFRTALANVRAAHYKAQAAPLDEQTFEHLWKPVQQHTMELQGILGATVQKRLDKGDKSGALLMVARQQRLYLDRADTLKVLDNCLLAISDINEAEVLRGRHESLASEEIHVETHTPQGIERLKRNRGDAVGFYGRIALQLERIQILRLWTMVSPEDDAVKKSLLESFTEFVEEHPGHEKSYNILGDIMRMRGHRDLDEMRKILDATTNKSSPQFVSNQVSLANCLEIAGQRDSALNLYTTVLDSGRCPPNRLAEVYSQMGDIYVQRKNPEKAKEYYKLAQSLSDKFKHIDQALKHIEQNNPPPQPDRRAWMAGLLLSHIAIAAIVFAYLRKRRRSAP